MFEFIKKLYSQYVNSNWARVISLIAMGTVLLVINLSFPDDTSKSFGRRVVLPLIGALGKTILAGGFLAFFLKSFQFIGIFRDEISRVVFAQDFLTKTTLKYKEEIWKNVTNSLYQSAFPEISSKIANIIYDKYVPKDLEFYYENMVITYELEKFDANHIAITEKQSVTIRSTAKEICYRSKGYVLKKDDPADLSDVEITKLTINGEDITKPPYLNVTNETIDGKIEKTVKVTKNISNQNQYFVTKTVKSIQSIESNVYWKNESIRYVKNCEIIVKQNPTFEVDFITFGLNIDLKSIPDSEIRRHEDLLIPGEGYVIIIKNKSL